MWCDITGFFGFACETEIQVVETKVSTTIPPPPEESKNYTITTSPNGTPIYTTVVEEHNTYITNPTTIIRQGSSGGSGSSEGVSLELFHKQVDRIYDSMGDAADGVREDMDAAFAGFAESFSTALLAVSGNASIGGDLNVVGTLTAGSLSVSGVSSGGAVEAPYFTATSTTQASTFPYASTTAISSTYASSTNGFFGNLSVGNLTGFLKATAGAISTATIDLVNDVGSSILAVANGGTGAATFTNNRILTGNGTGALVDEANLTFDGSLLTVSGNASTTQLTTTGATYLATTGGNVGIGTTSPTATLSVQRAGETILNLSNSSATSNGVWSIAVGSGNQLGHGVLAIGLGSSFLVANQAISFSSGGTTEFGNATASSLRPKAALLSLQGNSVAAGNLFQILTNNAGNTAITSGTQNVFQIGLTFQPTSGTGVYTTLDLIPTINQTGGANGITRGIYIHPTLTSAADYRAIETTVGNVILNSTSGNTGIGTTSPYAKLSVVGQTVSEYFTATSTTATSTFFGVVNIGANGGNNRRLYVSTAISGNPLAAFENTGGVGAIEIIGNSSSASDINLGSAAIGSTQLGKIRYNNATNMMQLYTNSTARLNIDTNGNVGIGTTTPSAKLAITQSAQTAAGGFWLAASDNTDYRSMFMNTSGVLSFNGGDTAGTLNTATLNAAGEWTNASDIAYKENIENLSYGLDALMALQPRSYDIKNTDDHRIGFIAQEVELVIPEVVGGVNGSKGISYGNLVAVVVKAIQELAEKVSGFAESFTTKRLCLEDVCITKSQLQDILDEAGEDSAPVPPPTIEEPNDTPPDEISEPDTEPPAETPTEEPTPEPEPEPTPESTPETP